MALYDGSAYIDAPGGGWAWRDDEPETDEIAVSCEFCHALFPCLRDAEYHECPDDKVPMAELVKEVA